MYTDIKYYFVPYLRSIWHSVLTLFANYLQFSGKKYQKCYYFSWTFKNVFTLGDWSVPMYFRSLTFRFAKSALRNIALISAIAFFCISGFELLKVKNVRICVHVIQRLYSAVSWGNWNNNTLFKSRKKYLTADYFPLIYILCNTSITLDGKR